MRQLCLLISLLLVIASLPLTAQGSENVPDNLAVRLGYPAGTKLLIVHADDLAVTHATNVASIAALEKGSVSSASIMANCPWLPEVAEWARANPGHDLGMHLVLTSEWRKLRWGSVASADEVSSLLDSSGYLKPLCQSLYETATAEEVGIEIRAQIDKARSLGIEPTHLDSHMGCLVYNPDFFAVYMEVSREYNIPAMVSRGEVLAAGEAWRANVRPDDLVIDHIHTAGIPDFERSLDNYYREVLDKLEAGVSVLLIHTALDGAESAGMAGGVEGWGNRWRQQDYNFFTSDDFLNILKSKNIQLTTWREINAKWTMRQ